jgi:hypothetical protein
VRYAFYIAIYLVWAAALAYSIKQYRANRELDQEIISEAEKAPTA